MQTLAAFMMAIQEQLLWLGGMFLLFAVLQKFTPCNPDQPLWRRSALTDLGYYFILPLFTRFIRLAYMSVGVALLFHGLSDDDIMGHIIHGHGPLSEIPVWAQAAIIFLVSDVILYWLHRWFHGRRMWKWHAIHHSPTQVDWMSTYRFHPVNTWLSFTLVDTLMLLAGFSLEAVTLMAGFNAVYSAMVHANLNWTFGPFKYCFASPVFHRWHHTAQEEGRDKNFAPTFPLLDIVFGTFYMPEGRVPQQYGVPDSKIPETSFLGQMLWPFKQ